MRKKLHRSVAWLLLPLWIAGAGFCLLCTSGVTEIRNDRQTVLTPPAGYTFRNGAIDLQGTFLWREPGARIPLMQVEMEGWQAEVAALPGGVLGLSLFSRTGEPKHLYLRGATEGVRLPLRLSLRDGWIRFHWHPDAEPVNCPVRNFRLGKGRFALSPALEETACTLRRVSVPKLCIGIALMGAGLLMGTVLLLMRCRSGVARPRLKWGAIGIAAGFLLAEIIVWCHIFRGENFYPFNTFLFRPGLFADDLFQTFACVRYGFMPYAWSGAGNYLPLTYFLLYGFPSDRLDLLTALLYGAFAAALAFPALKIVRPGNRIEGAATVFLAWCTLPVLLLWNSGNLEMLIYVLCLAFVLTYRRHPAIAAVLLAVAINVKLYPGVLGVLFLTRKDWKNAAVCAAVSILFFLGAANAVGGDFGKVFSALGNFSDVYLRFINDGLIFSHSLMSLYRYVGHHWFGLTGDGVLAAVPVYCGVCAAVFGGVLLALFRRKYALWQELYLLLGCAVLLPPVSFDYTLVLLLIPFWFFLRGRRFLLRERICLFLWVLIFIPENYCASPLWPELQVSVFIKPIALIAMGVVVLTDGFQRKNRYFP